MESTYQIPRADADLGLLGQGLSGAHQVILQPDTIAPEWWAGAPTVARGADGVYWMACRMRTADAPRGLRGYEVRLLKSPDGDHFETVRKINREEIPIPGFERPALVVDPKTGLFHVFVCGPWQGGPWSIIKFDPVASPEQVALATARPVIVPRAKTHERDIPPSEYKDPVFYHDGNALHCYVIGYIRQNERIFHFRSVDGENFEPVGNPYEPLMPLSGWHDFFVRPASVLPAGAGWLFVYEGSKTTWQDPVYNIGTGLGFTFDLHRIIDLTPDAPLALSATPGPVFHTFRYSHWMVADGMLRVYAEVACANGTNEIRLFKLPAPG